MRFKRAFGVAVGRDGSGRFWFAERYAPMVLTLVAFAVVAFAPQLGDASPRHPHRANGWARTLYKPKLAHVSLPKLGPGNRIASKGPARPAKAPKGKPLPLLTTATSRAYATKNGMTETRIFAAPVNYKGTDEKWHPIQNRLVSAGKGALRNKANRYKLTLPRTANRPVRMRIGRSWLSFKLVGAHGKASVRRNIATYKNALDNVSLSYAAEGGVVKESLLLNRAPASASYAFDLRASRGVRIRRRGAELVATGKGGRVIFRFVAPFAYALTKHNKVGARHRVSMRLAKSGHGARRLLLSVDSKWLDKQLAKGKVVIDPTLGADQIQDCSADSSEPDANYCAADYLDVGWAGNHDHHAFLKFDIEDALYPDSVVFSAQLGLYMFDSSTNNEKSVSAVPVTKPWTSGLNWNTYDGTNQWDTAGGDVDGSYKATNPAVGGSDGWYYWYPTDLVQQWADGLTPNNGLMLEDTNPQQVNNDMAFTSTRSSYTDYTPYLDVVTEPRGEGASSKFTFKHTQLTSEANMDVNVASGDLRIDNLDMAVPGDGLDFNLHRIWDSLNQEHMDFWRWAGAFDTVVYPLADSTRLELGAPDGGFYPLTRQPDGTFKGPFNYDATLCEVDGTTCTGNPDDSQSTAGEAVQSLTFPRTGEKDSFDQWQHLISRAAPNGKSIVSHDNWDGTGTGYYIDTEGRHINFTYTDVGPATFTSPSGAKTQYKYDTTSFTRLNKYINSAGGTTTYAYTSGWGDLQKLTDPAGHQWTFVHDGYNRVTSSKQVTNNANGTGLTTTYAYWPGSDTSHGHACSVTDHTKKTVITDPNGDKTTYCANVYDEVFEVWDKNGVQNSPPRLQLSGSLTGRQTLFGGRYALHVDAQDGASGTVPSGVKSIEILLDGHSRDYAEQTCAAGGCAMSRDWSLEIGDSGLDSGSHTVTVDATDQTGLTAEQTFSFTKGSPPVPTRWHQRFERLDMGGGESLGVNVANGSLLLTAQELKVAAQPADLSDYRYWNSVDAGAPGSLGRDWRERAGGMALTRNSKDGSYTLTGPDGSMAWFNKRADGSFEDVDDTGATLVENADHTIKLTFVNGDRWDFDDHDPHRLEKIIYANGAVVDPQYGAHGISQVSDNAGHSLTLTYNADGDPTTVTDQTGTTWSYSYNSGHDLTSYTAPDGKVWQYHYSGALIDSVTTPTGHVWRISYDNNLRATDITDDDGQAGTTDPATHFSYSSEGWATVTYPDGHTKPFGPAVQSCSDSPSCSAAPDVCAAPAPSTATTPGDQATVVSTAAAADAVEQAMPEAVAESTPETALNTTSDPSLDRHGQELDATGTSVDSTISANPENGISIESDDTTLCLKPAAVAETATPAASVADGDGVIFANTATATDTVARPIGNGVETFTSLRDDSAPNDISYKIDIPHGDRLEQTSDSEIEIVDPTPPPPVDFSPDMSPPTQEMLDRAIENGTAPPDAQLSVPTDIPTPAEAIAQAGVRADDGSTAGPDLPPPPGSPEGDPLAPPLSDEVDTGTLAAAIDSATTTSQQAAQDQVDQLNAQANAQAQTDAAERTANRLEDQTRPQVVATIAAPASQDAAGQSVPTTLSTDGDTVTMHVDTTSNDYEYPIVADPYVTISRYVTRYIAVPIFQYQTVFDHWNPVWNFIANGNGHSLILHYPDYDWGPSWGWWGWHNIDVTSIGRGWITSCDANPCAEYTITWNPVFKTVPVLVGATYYPYEATEDVRVWVNDPSDDDGASAASASTGNKFQVMTWNIRGDSNPPAGDLAAMIVAHQPAVVALQEACSAHLADLKSALAARHYKMNFEFLPEHLKNGSGHPCQHAGGLNGNALFTRPLVSAQATNYWYYQHTVPTDDFGRSLLSQVVTAHGRAVRVFTTHLDVHHVDDRYYETSDVAAFASHPNNASRSVVAGDLNTDEHERASFGPLVFQPFWSADVFHRDLASGGTFYANGTKPDWIFAGPNMGILNTGMLSSMNHALSDHYPLVANMAVG